MSADSRHVGDAPRDPQRTHVEAPRNVDDDVDAIAAEHEGGVVDRVAESFSREPEPHATADARESVSSPGRDPDDVIERVASHPPDDRQADSRAPNARPAQDARANDPALGERIDRELSASSPELAALTRKLINDREHPLDLTRMLRDPTRRDRSLELLAELGEGRLLQGKQTVADYSRDHPGRGPLFEPVAREINYAPGGRSHKEAYVEAAKAADSPRSLGPDPDDSQRPGLERYVRHLDQDVLPAVIAEIETLVEAIPDAQTSARVKTADGILDKVERMASGSESRPPRPDYQVGDVIDAVGARITVEDTRGLATVLQRCQDHFRTGDDGRVLEIENMYAAPKESSPAYRVVPMIVAIEVNDRSYTYELQLSTRRASVAADLEHNTVYKPYVETTADERREVMQAFHEAAALDQEETRRHWP